jgi:aminopeptidase N
MIRRTLGILMFLATAAAAPAAWWPPADKAMPGDGDMRWPGRIPATDDRGYDVLHLDLTVDFATLPPATPRLEGRVRLRLRLLDPAPSALRLDLVDQMPVDSLLVDATPTAFTQAGDSLLVPLPDGLVAGDTVMVDVRYGGSPPRHGPMWAGLLVRYRDGGEPTVGNVSQPYSSHSWFPGKDHPADKATLALNVTVPDTLTVSATGRLLGTVDEPGARRTWRWRSDHPVASYLVGVAVSDFVSWQEDCPCAGGDVPLHYHAFAEHLEQAEAAYSPTCAMMQWLEDLAGPYPFADEKYAQAEFVWGGAMENQTVTVFGQASLTLPDTTAQLVTVHELAHHWFGNSLTPRAWRDIWLNEGFARYAELLWLEHDRGEDAYRSYLRRLRPDDLFVGDGLLGDPAPVLPNLLVYDKGAWVLHMLRRHVGDAAFFRFLRDYATAPHLVYGSTDRQAMTAAVGAAAGADLAAFLAPWLDTDAVPSLDARWRRRGRETVVEVVQVQDGPFFPLTVPVRVHAGAATVDVDVRLDAIVGAVSITLDAEVDSVVVDPDRLLLCRTVDTPPPALLAALPAPNPGRDQISLAFWTAAADRVTVDVLDLRGRRVRRADLGAVPATGPRDEGGVPHRWVWDGCDDGGRPVSAGVYWLVVSSTTDRSPVKATLLR